MTAVRRPSKPDRGLGDDRGAGMVGSPSLLSAYAQNVIEASWLVALIVTPLFFNPYVNQFFEPSKAALVRTIALVMLAAWIVRGIEAFRWRGIRGEPDGGAGLKMTLVRARRAFRTWAFASPLALPTFLVVATYFIATVTSISPALSTFGSHERSQGLLTTLSYIVIALLVAQTVRTRAQVDRAVNTILIVSFPVAFYAVIQRYGLDPLEWPGGAGFGGNRVASTIGNPIFLGAYLLMIIPVTLGHLLNQTERMAITVRSMSSRILLYGSALGTAAFLTAVWGWSIEFGPRRSEPIVVGSLPSPADLAAAQGSFRVVLVLTAAVIVGWWVVGWWKGNPSSFLLLGVLASLLAVQIVAIVFTQSRGPFLGVLIGLSAFAVLYFLVRHARRAALGILCVGALSVLSLVLLNVTAWDQARSRLWRVFDLEDSTSQVRALIWRGALQLGLPHRPLWSPTTGDDTLNSLRPLIGYGPETLSATYHAVFQPELASLAGTGATVDRAHNAILDVLVTTGALGVGAYLALMTSVFLFGLQRLGLVEAGPQRRAFLALWLGGAAIGALFASAMLGWHFIGLGIPGGMIAGFFLYLAASAVRPDTVSPDASAKTVLLVALFAALLGHFVEVQFSFTVTPSSTYFWFFLALLVVVGATRFSPGDAADVVVGDDNQRSSTSSLVASALLTGLILAVLAFSFVSPTLRSWEATDELRTIDVAIWALTTKATTEGQQLSLAMLWLLLGTLVLGLALTASGARGWLQRSLEDWVFAVVLIAAAPLMVFFVVVFFKSRLTAAGNEDGLYSLIRVFPLFICLVVAIVFLVAGAYLLMNIAPRRRIRRSWSVLVAVGLGVVVIAATASATISNVQTDVIYVQLTRFPPETTSDGRIQLFERRLETQPAQDYPLVILANAYLGIARGATDPDQRRVALERAERALQRARDVNPFSPDLTLQLAELHYAAAGMATDPAERSARFQSSLGYYAQAVRLSPRAADVYERYAYVLIDYSEFLEEQEDQIGSARARVEALDHLQRARALASPITN